MPPIHDTGSPASQQRSPVGRAPVGPVPARSVPARSVPVWRALLLAAGTAMLLTACSPAPKSAGEPRPGSASGDATVRPPESSQDEAGGLVGSSWQLAELRTAGGQVLIPSDPSLYTLSFLEDARLGLRVDCNQAGGPWSAPAPGEITIGPLVTTLAACPPGSLAPEVLPALESVTSYSLEGGLLRLGPASGGPSLLFWPMR